MINRRLSLLLVALLAAYSGLAQQDNVLVFYKTKGFHHASIADGIGALMKLGDNHGFKVDTTQQGEVFNTADLQRFKLIVFLNTTGDVLNDEQQLAMQQFIHQGGGFVGIHSATDTEYSWPWYGKMVGAWFNGHPSNPNVQSGTIHVSEKNHPSTKDIPDPWTHEEEYYNFKEISPAIHILLTVDERSYHGGTNGALHPISWYQEFDGGRIFYTALGHTKEDFSDPIFLAHLLGGVEFALHR
jgi:type 1 glutamine amidotransferase